MAVAAVNKASNGELLIDSMMLPSLEQRAKAIRAADHGATLNVVLRAGVPLNRLPEPYPGGIRYGESLDVFFDQTTSGDCRTFGTSTQPSGPSVLLRLLACRTHRAMT